MLFHYFDIFICYRKNNSSQCKQDRFKELHISSKLLLYVCTILKYTFVLPPLSCLISTVAIISL